MEIKMGSKIKSLRKQKNISQEVLAQYLGVSFQAVSKWESEAAMPDIALVPAIASFFGVSTDELFDYNRFEMEKRVEEIVEASVVYRGVDDAKCEEILREGLKKYPGNDILLNCLIYSIPVPERSDEVISICKSLIEGTKDDSVKYDACRILAETYKALGEYELTKETIAMIPEIYFSKVELDALLLKGEDRFKAAKLQRSLSLEDLLEMQICLVECYVEQGDMAEAQSQLELAKKVLELFKEQVHPNMSKVFGEEFAKAEALI